MRSPVTDLPDVTGFELAEDLEIISDERGVRIAREEGCSALVLGHHREDILETFFMNFFHGGRLAAMPPKLLNDEGDVLVLRPLSYCAEHDLEKFAAAMEFPIIPCNLCGSQENLQRVQIKTMLAAWEREYPR